MVSNKWLPLEQYRIYANTDKIIITLGKGLLHFNNFIIDEKLIITKEILEIIETTDYHDNEIDNVLQKNLSWKVRIDFKNFYYLREALRDSFNYSLNITDVAPSRIECFYRDKKIYDGQFNDGSKHFTEFLNLSLKAPILRKKFDLYRFNKYYDKKKTSYGDDLPF